MVCIEMDTAIETMAQMVPCNDFGDVSAAKYSFSNFDLILEDSEVPSITDFEALYYDQTSPTMFSPSCNNDLIGEYKESSLKENCSMREEATIEDMKPTLINVLDFSTSLMQYPQPSDISSHAEAGYLNLKEILEENQRLRNIILQSERRKEKEIAWNLSCLRKSFPDERIFDQDEGIDSIYLQDLNSECAHTGEFMSEDQPSSISTKAVTNGNCESDFSRAHSVLGPVSNGFAAENESSVSSKCEVSEEPFAKYDNLGASSKSEAVHEDNNCSVLKKFLSDQSYISKYNYDPREPNHIADIAIKQESGIADKIHNEVFDSNKLYMKAVEQEANKIEAVCRFLDISPEPFKWSEKDVRKWLTWAVNQYNLPEIDPEFFRTDGIGLISLSEEEFHQKASEAGALLHSCLYNWNYVWNCINSSDQKYTGDGLFNKKEEFSDLNDMKINMEVQDQLPEMFDEEDSTEDFKDKSKNGSHIHLWQFLRELLQSQKYSSCIRWIDRRSGIFKIEDSVQVAKLWGNRKNRPAMNYDKLSRSIRQYYKKGIMKKTERSQRLVYQFCHPYCL